MKKTGGTVEISAVTSYNDYDAVHLCMLQRIQDITIFELTYVMDKPEMEEILYERENAPGEPDRKWELLSTKNGGKRY